MKIELCKEDMIDYKILNRGTASVTDSELISVIIGERIPDKSRELLQKNKNNLQELGRSSYYDLRKSGLSHMKAIGFISAIELGRRRKLSDFPDANKISCSRDISELFKPLLSDLDHEEFWVVFLNRSNRILNHIRISSGGISGTVTDVKMIMKKAVEHLASGIIICHNHPSGNLQPSESDVKITQKIKEAGNIFDIHLLDHIIVSEKDYYSFADNGIL